MGDFIKYSWNDYRIRLVPNRVDIRHFIKILPYFWNREIILDLEIKPKNKIVRDEIWSYSWELVDIEDEIIKQGEGNIDITQKEYRRYKDIRKSNALILGYLQPNKHYRIYLTIKNALGEECSRYSAGTCTIKDKDEYQMQILILLIGISFAFLIAIFERGCR